MLTFPVPALISSYIYPSAPLRLKAFSTGQLSSSCIVKIQAFCVKMVLHVTSQHLPRRPAVSETAQLATPLYALFLISMQPNIV